MTWLAISDHTGDTARTEPPGIPVAPDRQFDLIAVGSLIIDLDFSLAHKAPSKLISYTTNQGWERRFTVYLNADYTLSAEIRQGDSRSYVRLANINLKEAGAVRLTYAWDAPGKLGLFSAETAAKNGTIHQSAMHAPVPVPFYDIVSILGGTHGAVLDNRVQYLALSDRVEPVGPTASIAGGTPVETPGGPRAIERLQQGDLVNTKSNGAQPVRWIIKQNLPATGRTAPIRLRAPFFGLTRDLVVAKSQRIMIDGTETEYNIGQDAVLIEVSNLIAHPVTSPVTGSKSTTFYQIILGMHDCINLCGTWADSLYIGHLKNAPEILATTGLAKIPEKTLPVHNALAHPILRDYERQAMLDTLIA